MSERHTATGKIKQPAAAERRFARSHRVTLHSSRNILSLPVSANDFTDSAHRFPLASLSFPMSERHEAMRQEQKAADRRRGA